MAEKYSEEDVENDVSNLLSDGEEARVSEDGTQGDESDDDAILVRKVFTPCIRRVIILKSS